MGRTSVHKKVSDQNRFGWAPFYLGVIALCAILSIVAFQMIQQREQQVLTQDLKAQHQAEVNVAALALSIRLQKHADHLQAVAAFVSTEPKFSNWRFYNFAEKIVDDYDIVRSISAAPDFVIDRVFPASRESQLLGFDYNALGNENALSNANRAIKYKNVLFAGPYLRENGEKNIVGTYRVITRDYNGQETFWGVVSMEIDFRTLVANAGLTEVDYRIAMRGRDARGVHGGIFWGDRSVFAAEPVTARIDLPIGSWVIAAAPQGGWVPDIPFINQFHMIFWAAVALITALILGSMRLMQTRFKANANVANAINSIQDGFAHFDHNGRLLNCNAKYTELHGGAKNLYVEGAQYSDLLRSAVSRGQFVQALDNEKAWIKEHTAEADSDTKPSELELGDGRWIRLSRTKTSQGDCVHFIVDISETMEARLDAERANKVRTDILDVMSHELRSPLTVVLGGTPFLVSPELLPATQKVMARLNAMGEDQALLRKDMEKLLSSVKGLAGKVERSAKHLLTLINEVLDFSKIEAGNLNLDRITVPCREAMDSAISGFIPDAANKGLAIQINPIEQVVHADPVRLAQIFGVLLDNAIKYTDQGTITVSAQSFGDFVRFTVADTGTGIPAAKLPDLFDEFAKLKSSDHRRSSGTGLGLAITRKLVKMHGGDIGVRSVEGEGSAFSFTIPKALIDNRRAA